MLSPSPIAPHISCNMRYAGSRIAAGFSDVHLVADLLEMTAEEYASYEDIMGPSIALLHQMARLFGVSLNYLIFKKAVTEREQLAELIADGLARYEARYLPRLRNHEGVKLFPDTLAAMRSAAGYGTAAEAATALGWNPLLYAAHEQGARPIGTHLLNFYAVSLGMRPDNALLGEKPEPLWKSGESWWRMQRRVEYSDTDALVSPSFDWLAFNNCAHPSLSLPMVQHVDGKWSVQKENLSLPRSLLPAASATAGNTLYAMVERLPEGLRIIVVDPTTTGRSSVTANAQGELLVVRDEAAIKVVDPTHHRPRKKGGHFCVGSYVAMVATFA